MNKTLKIASAALAMGAASNTSLANNCRSPAWALTVVNEAVRNLHGQNTAAAKLKALGARLSTQRDEMGGDAVAARIAKDGFSAFYADVGEASAARVADMRTLAAELDAAGEKQASAFLNDYVASYEAMTPEAAKDAVLGMAASKSVPDAITPTQKLAREELAFNCGMAMAAHGEIPQAENTPAFWQRCGELANASADRPSAEHFTTYHTIAEPLVALQQGGRE